LAEDDWKMKNDFPNPARRSFGKGALTLLFTLIVSLLLPATLYAQRRGSGRPAAASSSSAEQEAAKFWSRYVASCGGSHYLRKAPGIFVELRGFRVQVRYAPITEADRLNGVEAKGQSWFEASAYRTYSNSAWHAWGNGIPDDVNLTNKVNFQKSRGRWNFYGTGYFSDYARPVTCSDVPGFSSRATSESPTNTVLIDDTHEFPIKSFIFWDANTNEVGTRFSQSLTTYISWQITYEDTAFFYQLPPVESYWYKDGQQWAYNAAAQRKGGGYGVINDGRGWDDPGHWEAGTYTVKLYLRKKLIAVKQFEIVPDDQLPKQLRFDGFYRLDDSVDSGWFRFYEDGSYLFVRAPKHYNDLGRIAAALSSVRDKYVSGWDELQGLDGGRWVRDDAKQLADWRIVSGASVISFGKESIGYNAIFFGTLINPVRYTFIKSPFLCPDDRSCPG
jgi:hypothetical protein